jgi:hypothetical protein
MKFARKINKALTKKVGYKFCLKLLILLQDPYINPPRMPLSGMLPSAASSTPATPTGTRRAHHQQLQLHGLGVDMYGNR